MAVRRSLIEGLKSTPPAIEPEVEKQFVFQKKETPAEVAKPVAVSHTVTVSRVPISTRIRSDFSAALKRASLERQLEGTQPNTLQDILEAAIEPWLREHGYLS